MECGNEYRNQIKDLRQGEMLVGDACYSTGLELCSLHFLVLYTNTPELSFIFQSSIFFPLLINEKFQIFLAVMACQSIIPLKSVFFYDKVMWLLILFVVIKVGQIEKEMKM